MVILFISIYDLSWLAYFVLGCLGLFAIGMGTLPTIDAPWAHRWMRRFVQFNVCVYVCRRCSHTRVVVYQVVVVDAICV